LETKPNFLLTGKCFPLTNFSNDKQIQECGNHFPLNKRGFIFMVRHFMKGRDLIRSAATQFVTAYLTLGCLNDHKMQLITIFTSK